MFSFIRLDIHTFKLLFGVTRRNHIWASSIFVDKFFQVRFFHFSISCVSLNWTTCFSGCCMLRWHQNSSSHTYASAASHSSVSYSIFKETLTAVDGQRLLALSVSPLNRRCFHRWLSRRRRRLCLMRDFAVVVSFGWGRLWENGTLHTHDFHNLSRYLQHVQTWTSNKLLRHSLKQNKSISCWMRRHSP